MKEYFDWAKTKIYDAYSFCTDTLSQTASAIKEKIPAQTRDMLSRPFSDETRAFVLQSPETQRAVIVAATATGLYAGLALINQFNNTLLNDEMPGDEYSFERHARYLAHITNHLLWLFVMRQSIRMMIAVPLNTACISKAIVLDHPHDHHQKDCREKHPELADVSAESVNWFFRPYYDAKHQFAEWKKFAKEAGYITEVMASNARSGMDYIINMQLAKMLCVYLPYGQYMEILLRTIITGYSLPEYNHANKCAEHKQEEIRGLNTAAITVGFLHAMFTELAFYITGNSYVKEAAGSMFYQLLIPVIMSKPIKSEHGNDYFYYNREGISAVMDVVAGKTFDLLLKQGGKIKLMYESLPAKIEENTIYLYLRNNEEPIWRFSSWIIQKEKKTECKEWIEISFIDVAGKEQQIKVPEEILEKHAESIKDVLKSKDKRKVLETADEQILYMLAFEFGFPKLLNAKLREIINSSYVQFTQAVLVSSDLHGFVRRPDVKFFLDYHSAGFRKTRDIVQAIKDNYFVQMGNSVPSWVFPQNLQNLKKLLELIVSKSDGTLAGLHNLLTEYQAFLNEYEQGALFKKVHEPLLLEQVPAKTVEELQGFETVKGLVKVGSSEEYTAKAAIIEIVEQPPQSSEVIQIPTTVADSVSVSAKSIPESNSSNTPTINLGLAIMDDYQEEKKQSFTLPNIMEDYQDGKKKEVKEEQPFTVEDEDELFALLEMNTPTKPAPPLLVGGSIIDMSFFEDYDPSKTHEIKPNQTVLQQRVAQYR